jgi:hypothetical protein
MHALSEPIRDISSNLRSLRDFVDVLGAFLNQRTKESVKMHASVLLPLLVGVYKSREFGTDLGIEPIPEDRMDKLLEKFPEAANATVAKSEDGDGVTVTFPASVLTTPQDFGKAVEEVLRAHRRTQMLSSSCLLNLTSSVELFFSKLLHHYFSLHPEAIGTKEKLFSFEDLSKFVSVTEARDYYISSKIEELLRGSLVDWFNFARNTIKLSMGYLKDDQELLEESFQRRNVVVHNGGSANSIYFSKVPEHLRDGIKLGDDLTPDDEYLGLRIDLWEKTCILIAAELWKKMAPDDTERAEVLADIIYRHLLAGRWRVSEALSTFLMRDKQMPEATLLGAQLNYWQSGKRLGKWNLLKPEVEAADFSAKGLRFQLGYLALVERNDDFFSLVPRALQAGEISDDELQEYPIFYEMRSDPRFDVFRTKPKKRAVRRRTKKDISDE